MQPTYVNEIHEIAVSTFEITCYMFPLAEWEMDDAASLQQPEGEMRSIVQFDGAAEGAMVINPSATLAEAIAANMLGVETADNEQKQGALCEIANIICGNTVPLFAKDNDICYIRPPRIAGKNEDTDQIFKGMDKESLRVFLDEGVAEITIYYSKDQAA